MSLEVRLVKFKLKTSRRERYARLEFRRDVQVSYSYRDMNEFICMDQIFDWKLKYPAQPGEVLSIELLSSKWNSTRSLGMYLLSMDTVVRDGTARIIDALADTSNKNSSVYVEFHVNYIAPPTAVTRIVDEIRPPEPEVQRLPEINIPDESNMQDQAAAVVIEEGDQEGGKLEDIERIIANVERTMKEERDRGEMWSVKIEDDTSSRRMKLPGKGFLRRTFSFGSGEKSSTSSDSPRRAFKGMRNLFRFGKHRRRTNSYDEEAGMLLEPATSSRLTEHDITSSEDETDTSNCSGDISPMAGKKSSHWPVPGHVVMRPRDFQVCVTIIEARQLAGLNIDPIVSVSIENETKYTSTKDSTNCPYYNEYFVFDFNLPHTILFDKIITLTVFHYRNILRSKKIIGTFKLDVATVWNQQDRQFHHKWALLTDPVDVASGPRGYLKCNISVMGKGDSIRTPSRRDRDDDDIEANLLIPAGMPIERQRARFVVKIYRAEGLPKMNSSVIANVKQAITGEALDLVDSYVQVSYAGRSACTTVKKNTYSPEWNEQIIFTEMFPPLCQRIKIELRDNNIVGHNKIIGTHFIDLKTISNDGDKGFLPTFGPAYVHLYGSTRDYTIIDELSGLNTGEGEGVAYRARILVEVATEFPDNIENYNTNVEILSTIPLSEPVVGKIEEFFLMGCIFEANAMDNRLANKKLHFELSIGNSGNCFDGLGGPIQYNRNDLDTLSVDTGFWISTTEPCKAQGSDDNYYYNMPYWEQKQCLHVRSVWPDQRQRLYNSNAINCIIEAYEFKLTKVQTAINLDLEEGLRAVNLLKETLEEFGNMCTQYVTLWSTAPPLGNTKLDKNRLQMCIFEIGHLGALARNLKGTVVQNTVKDKLRTAYAYLNKLKFICEDPQHSLPDVFIWLVSGNNRIAYLRIPARDILYSQNSKEKGKFCGNMQTFFLKWPGKKASTDWVIPAKLNVYLWLGVMKDKALFATQIPTGFENNNDLQELAYHPTNFPRKIYYPKSRKFQLRSYIYQARSLIGSDTSGLSDPYARVVVSDRSGKTEIIYETLSPTWDQMLVFDDITLISDIMYIKNAPPTIVIEIYDQDKLGRPEFIGRTMARPTVKGFDEEYALPNFPAKLSWHEIKRGDDNAGELLATFELLEIPPPNSQYELPALPPPKYKKEESPMKIKYEILPIPYGIRPTLIKYRIEVLFWGLRNLKRVYFQSVEKPRVDIECAGHVISSSVIENASRNPNFKDTVKYIDVELPDQDLYRPPLTIRVIDCRNFGRQTLVGTHTINSINKYIYSPRTKSDRQAEERQKNKIQLENIDLKNNCLLRSESVVIENEKENSPLLSTGAMSYGSSAAQKKTTPKLRKKNPKEAVSISDDNEDIKDWWTKYYDSMEAILENEIDSKSAPVDPGPSTSSEADRRDKNALKIQNQSPTKKKKENSAIATIFPHELEEEKDYEGFKEWLQSFELYRGKKTGDESEDEDRVVGVFKGAIKVYKWPLPKEVDDHTVMGFDPNNGFFQGIPNNDPKRVLVRVYIVRATGLHPMDFNGKADPYISLQLGTKKISDKDQYISKQLNPVFGKCFEFEATFPKDSMLTIKVLDWDLVSSDDLIGETKIDLENRFYSRHRATCGLPGKYEEIGYNRWRDSLKPTQILAKLCKEAKIDLPIYEPDRVRIGRTIFNMPVENTDVFSDTRVLEEQMALLVLHRWHEVPKVGTKLVVDHIERRPLYNSKQPGIEQGRLEIWIDMFPMDKPLPGPYVNITPRKPNPYELRVIIWNTDDVVLEDDAFFTGEKMSDIYVKGWLTEEEEPQCTDVHYRSLTGEGNFNWRFVHSFDYLEPEQKIVTVHKFTIFSWGESEIKLPPRYALQVWDADHFTKDDCLGALNLNLNRFPRGAKTSKLCTLAMLRNDSTVPMVNIFKQKRIKGWWPFYVKKEDEKIQLTGKVEAEFQLLTREEADKMPAGLGRSEPDPLDKPTYRLRICAVWGRDEGPKELSKRLTEKSEDNYILAGNYFCQRISLAIQRGNIASLLGTIPEGSSLEDIFNIQRPDATFLCLLNPLKSARYIIWRNYKWTILKGAAGVGITVLVLIFFYSIPGYVVKKLLGA